MGHAKLTTAFLLSCAATVAGAQNSSVLSVSPIPDEAEERFCYYAGLAYSPMALLTVEVPFRRESPSATQKRLMRCEMGDEDDGLVWRDFDIEQGNLPRRN